MVDLGRAFGWSGRPFGDKRPWTTGTVVAVDEAGARLEVDVDGARTVLPRTAVTEDQYEAGDTVLILRDPEVSGSGQVVLGVLGLPPEPVPPPATGTVTAVSGSGVTVDTEAGEITCEAIVSAVVASGDDVLLMWDGSGTPWVVGKIGVVVGPPAAPSAPSLSRSGASVAVSWPAVAGATSYRVRKSADGGSTWVSRGGITKPSTSISIVQGQTLLVQVRAGNSGGAGPYSPSSQVSYPNPPAQTEQVTTTIRPSWSGTWRSNRGAWDQWNTNRYGGRSTLYQGSAHGSGPLTGLAVYGTRVRDLGAISIDRIEVTLRGADLYEGSYPSITVQGSPHGSRPGGSPSSSGATASGSPGKSGTDRVALPSSVREAFRTGGVRGLALVGGGYGAVRGTSAADGMALRVTYTRRK